MKYWTIRTFITDRGINVIKEWINDLPIGAKVEIERRFRYLETQKNWGRPYSAKLKGFAHIHELRIKWNRTQYRPLGFFGPRPSEFTVLIGAVEKGSKFEPKNAPIIADVRRKLVLENDKHARTYFEL
jgi:hypothetical protein